MRVDQGVRVVVDAITALHACGTFVVALGVVGGRVLWIAPAARVRRVGDVDIAGLYDCFTAEVLWPQALLMAAFATLGLALAVRAFRKELE